MKEKLFLTADNVKRSIEQMDEPWVSDVECSRYASLLSLFMHLTHCYMCVFLCLRIRETDGQSLPSLR